MTTSEMSPADFAAINNHDTGGMFGGGSAWWIIILFLFAFCGGWGSFGNNQQSGANDNYVLASDFATLQRQIDTAAQSLERKGDGIANGLADGFYAMNTGILNGFADVNSAVTTNGYETRNAIQAAQISEMQNANGIMNAINNCCCNNREAIAGVNYNMATNTNTLQRSIENGFSATGYNAATNTRDIVENATNNTRAILDALNAQAISQKDSKIAEQAQQIFALQLQASQCAQNAYLVNQLRPSPIPAYTVNSPCGCNV